MIKFFKNVDKAWLSGFTIGVEGVICIKILYNIIRVVYQQITYGQFVIGVNLWNTKFIFSSGIVDFVSYLLIFICVGSLFINEIIKDVKLIKEEVKRN